MILFFLLEITISIPLKNLANMKIIFLTSFIPTVVAAGLVLGSSVFSPANAYGVTPTNAITLNSSDVNRELDRIKWLVPASTTGLSNDLSAEAVITVKTLDSNFLELAINFLNTTSTSLQAAVTGFGLAVDPDATSVNLVAGEFFDNAELQTGQQNFPGGFKGIDICAFSSQNCSGGDIKSGLQAGSSDTFTLKIGGNFSKGVTIASYPVKFQTEGGSFEAAGVPEPITVIGSGLALGFGALLKKEASKKHSKEKIKS